MWAVTDDDVKYYATLGQVKKPNVDYYKAMLPVLLDKVNEDYNTCFTPENMPPNVKLFLAKAVPFFSGASGLKSRKMGSVSYSFDFNDMPAAITDLLKRYRKARFHVFRPYG